ncbi:MAG TPA: VanZ family protein [Thermodesulfobacteriota bacterium]|nr:VanZ family protein [Thermodesulfobacteriota bacterium]
MRLIFTILSIVYISAIFILAGSPIVRILTPFNVYSLLHIPLYGILAFLLIFSIIPMTQLRNNLMTRFLMVGVIALGVGISDEIHQAYVPGRDASATDILLDMVGIILVLFFVSRLVKRKKSFRSIIQ